MAILISSYRVHDSGGVIKTSFGDQMGGKIPNEVDKHMCAPRIYSQHYRYSAISGQGLDQN